MADTTSIEGAASGGGEKPGKPVIGFGTHQTAELGDGATSENAGQGNGTDAHAAQARDAFSKEATDAGTKDANPGGGKNDSPPAGGERSGLKPGAQDKPVQDIHTQAQSMAKPPESTTQSTARIEAKQDPVAGTDKTQSLSNQSAKPPEATLVAQNKPDLAPSRTASTESLNKPTDNKPIEIRQQENKQTERTQTENKQTDLPKTGSQSDSGKAQDSSAARAADRPGLKTESQRNEPIGQTGRQNIESHAPPAQTSKSQEAPYQTPKTIPEAKQETRTVPVPVPTDTNKSQNSPVASQRQNQPETIPAAEHRDPAVKTLDARTTSSDQSRPISTDSKPASQAEQVRKIDESRSSGNAGDVGSTKSTHGESIAHEPPSTKEAFEIGKQADKHSNPIIEASVVDAKPQSVTHVGAGKELGVDNSHVDEKSIFLTDKSKAQPPEPVKDIPPGDIRGVKSGSITPESNITAANSTDGKPPSNDAATSSGSGKQQQSNDASMGPSESKHGDHKNNPLTEASVIDAKTQSTTHIGATKEFGIDNSNVDEKSIFLVDKNKNQQMEPGKIADLPGAPDRTHMQPGSDHQGSIASSRGISGDIRASDNSPAPSDKLVDRVIIKLGDLKVDLSSPETSKKFLDVLTQIQSGKVIASDPVSKSIAFELLSSKAGIDSVFAAHESKNLELIRQLLGDKLPPEVASDRFKLQWENPQLKTENELLKQKLREKDNVVEVAVREVQRSFANIWSAVVDAFHRQSKELPEPKLGNILDASIKQVDPAASIKETIDRERIQVLSKFSSVIGSPKTENEGQLEEEVVQISARPLTKDKYGNVRTRYTVKADESYESIALKQFGNECYGQLIESINRSYATTRDDGEYERHELAEGEILDMPTEDERDRHLKSLGQSRVMSELGDAE